MKVMERQDAAALACVVIAALALGTVQSMISSVQGGTLVSILVWAVASIAGARMCRVDSVSEALGLSLLVVGVTTAIPILESTGILSFGRSVIAAFSG